MPSIAAKAPPPVSTEAARPAMVHIRRAHSTWHSTACTSSPIINNKNKNTQRKKKTGAGKKGKAGAAIGEMKRSFSSRTRDALSTTVRKNVKYRHYQGFSRVMARPAGRVRRSLKCHRSGRVGSDRVESGQEVIEISRAGPGHPDPTRPDPTRPARFFMTRKKPRKT